jgi:hypothetical protein
MDGLRREKKRKLFPPIALRSIDYQNLMKKMAIGM